MMWRAKHPEGMWLKKKKKSLSLLEYYLVVFKNMLLAVILKPLMSDVKPGMYEN